MALKEIFRSYKELTAAEATAIIREITSMKCINHPLVVKLIDFFIEDKLVYIASEFASGGSLDTKLNGLLKNGQRLSEKEYMRYFAMLCCALQHVHEKTYVHRDVSPKNLFLKNFSGGRDLLILGDFGIVKPL